jgi:hypothetical protein
LYISDDSNPQYMPALLVVNTENGGRGFIFQPAKIIPWIDAIRLSATTAKQPCSVIAPATSTGDDCLTFEADLRILEGVWEGGQGRLLSEAKVAELVDALDSKSSGGDTVRVRVPSLVPALNLP